MSDDDDLRGEIARLIAVLNKIRDIAMMPDPRYPNMEWFKSKLKHIQQYLAEVFDES